jgi:hypothetical protein
MKRREVDLEVSDHAVLRYLERAFGLDVEAVRAMIAGKALTAAQLDACSVVTDGVRFMLRDHSDGPGASGAARVVVATVLRRDQRRGGGDKARRGKDE